MKSFRERIQNYFREREVRKIQEKMLKENYSRDIDRLIVFLTPGRDEVWGGLLSIYSIMNETKKLEHLHRAKVIVCTVPGEPALLHHTKIGSQLYVYALTQVLGYFQHLEFLMIHIPENYMRRFQKGMRRKDHLALKKIENVHVNILLQNITLMDIKQIDGLKKIGKVTSTTAHEQYTTLEMKKHLGIPLHKFSVYISPEQYDRKGYGEKEDIMVVSHDDHPQKSEILDLIKDRLPSLTIHVVKELPYEDYKKLIAKAKWALTFGEGLDGYFIETVFSGGISFAVYNERFFTRDFQDLRTVYPSYGELMDNICYDIQDLDDGKKYSPYQDQQFIIARKYYNYDEYIENIKLFYKGAYTYE